MSEVLTQPFCIYKPNKNGNGAASQLSVRLNKTDKGVVELLCFWSLAKQCGDKKFGWKEKDKYVNIKLGEIDICDVISVLSGLKSEVGPGGGKGRFHSFNGNSSVLKFSFDKEKNIYKFGVSTKKGDGEAVVVFHNVSIEEGVALKILLTDIVSAMYNFRNVKFYEKKN